MRGAAGRVKTLPRPPLSEGDWCSSRGRSAVWTLLKGLLQDHLDARDDAGHCIADLLDGLLGNLPRTLDGPGGSRRGRLLDIEANLLGAGDGALDGVPRDSADIAADLGCAHDGATEDVGYGRRQRGTHGTSALDGGHQCAADGVDGSVQDLTGALDRADHLVLHRFHDPLPSRIHLAHAGPPCGELWSLSGDGPTQCSWTPDKQNATPSASRAGSRVSHCAMSAAELTNHQRWNAQGLSRGTRHSTPVPRPSRPTSPSSTPSGSRRCSLGTRRRARFAKGYMTSSKSVLSSSVR